MSLIKHFYAQQGEDIYIYSNYINKVNEDAVFVELGGFDGLTYSNSKFFEDTLKFKGVLIEPTYRYNDMIKNRPNCKSYNLAVTRKNEIVSIVGDSAVASLTDSIHPDFRKKYHSTSSTYFVQGKRFDDILSDSKVSRIDLLTIDVEGGELAVLETMNFNIPVYVIVLEADEYDNNKNEACRKILKENGFVFDRHFCLNDVWYNPRYPYINSVYEPSPPLQFQCMSQLGVFHYMEDHCIPEIWKALIEGRSKD